MRDGSDNTLANYMFALTFELILRLNLKWLKPGPNFFVRYVHRIKLCVPNLSLNAV